MNFPCLHNWDLSPGEAIALQVDLARQVVTTDQLAGPVRRVAGVDVSYRRGSSRFHAAVVVLDAAGMEPLEIATASGEVTFPYIPGLLSFRELPILLEAFRSLCTVPDLILVDGQGRAHPRRLGLACHLGLWLDLPTIGCAKSRLCGVADEPGPHRGDWTALVDGGEKVGCVVRSRDRVRPLYVSPGHKVGRLRAVELVLQCARGYRLPEPTRQAHLLSNQIRMEDDVSRR